MQNMEDMLRTQPLSISRSMIGKLETDEYDILLFTGATHRTSGPAGTSPSNDEENKIDTLIRAVPMALVFGLMQLFFEVSSSDLTTWCTTNGKATMVARSVATVRGRPTSNVFSVISRRPFHSSTWAFFFTFVRPPMRRRGAAARGAWRRAPRSAAAADMCGWRVGLNPEGAAVRAVAGDEA